MFLKQLTLKGFKSFADPAKLELEPGITVVVGPNGSGKSNVVDALAWVLGAQAPKIVRSQKMDDVIFAGTSSKKALGRAEVSITIDNSDQVLPIEFTEVTITRILFRTGESEYLINGSPCRLLDVQELLSDSGVGRQQHIIVSQGRIDDVLNARPEDRRSIIEEAAGVLKFRKRKERAERRLAATEENMSRIKDVAREVKRQIRPLEKQADAARRYDTVVSELTQLKTHLVGRELSALQGKLQTDRRQRIDLKNSSVELKASLGSLDASILAAESELSALGTSDIANVIGQARSLTERIRGQRNVVTERRRRLEGELHVSVDEDVVANLEAEAARLQRELEKAEVEKSEIGPQFSELERAEAALTDEQLSFDQDWDTGVVEVSTKAAEVRVELQGARASFDRTAQQVGTTKEQIASNNERQQELTNRRNRFESQFNELTNAVPQLESDVETSAIAAEKAEETLTQTTDRRRAAEKEASRWKARADALTQALDEARAQAGIDTLSGADGVLGTLLDLVAIDEGWEEAAVAAIGEALQAIVIESAGAARKALSLLNANDTAGAVLALGSAASTRHEPVVADGRSLRPHVKARRSDVEPILDSLLGHVVVVDGTWESAVDASLENPTALIVTTHGDRFSPHGWRIGADSAGATGAALEEALIRSEETQAAVAEAVTAASTAQQEVKQGRQRQRQAEVEAQKAKNALSSAETGLKSATSEFEQLVADHSALETQLSELLERHEVERQQVSELAESLPALEEQEAEQRRRAEALSASRSSLEERSRQMASKRTELEVRVSALEQQTSALGQRWQETESRLERLVEEREQARSRRVKIEASLAIVAELDHDLDSRLTVVTGWVAQLANEQQTQSEAARKVSTALAAQRERRLTTERTLAEQTDKQNRLELAETESRVKLETLTQALRQDLDTEPETAMATEAPEIPEGKSPEARLRELERDLRLMGAINPLAIQEFDELKERYEFLETQLADVTSARRDLHTLIRSIDEEIVSVFASAYADVAENFKALFVILFPGGKGNLTLTNPEDILNCGIEIEAKPSGKNVKKLSLLSGGERSLVALAFLFAVFRSRPSPFYVMDEVEAALDDINLTRFLSLIEEFRKEAQLIIVSHQKRTMEGGDVLYGVSMKPGGSSKVVSERVDDRLAG